MYFHAGTADGKFNAKVRIAANGNGRGSFGGRTETATGWQGYKGLF